MTYLYVRDIWWQFLLLIIFSYLIGNLNFAIIISKLKKQDIRKIGSGNPGTLNMSRAFGLKIGLLTLVLDIFKGVIPTLLGYLLYKNYLFEKSTLPVTILTEIMCGFFAVLGHIFPAFMKFKGGKGIATTIGVFFVINWKIALISGIIAIIFILLTEIGSMGSFIATTPGAIGACISIYKSYVQDQTLRPVQITVIAISNILVISIIFLTWYAHRQNIKRLLAGEEHATNWLQMIKESRIKRQVKKNKDNEHN